MQFLIRIGLAALIAIGAAGPAFAQSEAPLLGHKQSVLARLRAEAAIIGEAMSCVQAAANDDGLRLCMAHRRVQEQALHRQERLR